MTLVCGCTCFFFFFFQILNVQVPFLFKLAVDSLTAGTGSMGALASNSSGLVLFATPVAGIDCFEKGCSTS